MVLNRTSIASFLKDFSGSEDVAIRSIARQKLLPLEGSCTTRPAKDPTLLPADHHPVLGVVEKHFATIERVGTPSDPPRKSEENIWKPTGNPLETHWEPAEAC